MLSFKELFDIGRIVVFMFNVFELDCLVGEFGSELVGEWFVDFGEECIESYFLVFYDVEIEIVVIIIFDNDVVVM